MLWERKFLADGSRIRSLTTLHQIFKLDADDGRAHARAAEPR